MSTKFWSNLIKSWHFLNKIFHAQCSSYQTWKKLSFLCSLNKLFFFEKLTLFSELIIKPFLHFLQENFDFCWITKTTRRSSCNYALSNPKQQSRLQKSYPKYFSLSGLPKYCRGKMHFQKKWTIICYIFHEKKISSKLDFTKIDLL